MADWTEVAQRKHLQAQAALARAVNSHAISVPVGDSDYSAPGYLYFGHFYSCIPDPLYPWDPAVFRAIRELCPDAMPVTVRSVWRWSNYGELGKLGEPLILVRHAIGRSIQDPIAPLHDFYCQMPDRPYYGLMIPGRLSLADCRPNYIEYAHWDRQNRPYGYDLEGEYLPCDWELYHRLRKGAENRERMLRESRQAENEDGQMIAKGAADSMIQGRRDQDAQTKKTRKEEGAYVMQDINRYHSIEPSDVEWRDHILGDGKTSPSAH